MRAFVANDRVYRVPERAVLAICADGWDPDYVDDALERRLMPRLAESLDIGGIYAMAQAQVPTFTNPNNVAIVTGVSAARNGVAGNQYRDDAGVEVQVTDPRFLRAETIHAAAQAAGVPALCVTAKDKLRRLLAYGGVPSFSAERAHEQQLPDGRVLTDLVGAPNPGIYEWELSPYTVDLALALARELGSRLIYASLTDFVQHKVAPGQELSDRFYRAMDRRIGAALDAGYVVGLAADHGMRAKTLPDGRPNVRYLDDRAERDVARDALAALHGVEAVLDGDVAADTYELPADRIGDLVVLADGDTVLGKSAAEHDLSAVGTTLRSHGGLHERAVPLIVCAPLRDCAPPADLRNRDLHDLLLNHTT